MGVEVCSQLERYRLIGAFPDAVISLGAGGHPPPIGVRHPFLVSVKSALINEFLVNVKYVRIVRVLTDFKSQAAWLIPARVNVRGQFPENKIEVFGRNDDTTAQNDLWHSAGPTR